MSEAETCRTLVRPKLEAAGWEANGERHDQEQIPVTAGRIVVTGGVARREPRKFPDFLLHFTRDLPLAVVEAKSDRKPAASGLQQAKDYARTLGRKFAYATNGRDLIEYDFLTDAEAVRPDFPTPAELWRRSQNLFPEGPGRSTPGGRGSGRAAPGPESRLGRSLALPTRPLRERLLKPASASRAPRPTPSSSPTTTAPTAAV